jgi:hypothetical protein
MNQCIDEDKSWKTERLNSGLVYFALQHRIKRKACVLATCLGGNPRKQE